MKKTIIAGLIFGFATGAHANEGCVDYLWGSIGYDQFVNNCPYTVVIKASFDNGYSGLWGPVTPGEKVASNPGSTASNVNWSYCNYSKNSACSP